MARLLSLAVLALLASCALAFKWEDCGVVGDAFAVSDVSLNPESVRVGSSAVFTVIGRNALNLTHGDIDMDVTYHGVHVHTEQDDLCEASSCPLPAGGPVVVTLEKGFPLITPPGTYNVTLHGTSGAHQLFCVSVEFSVSYWIESQ